MESKDTINLNKQYIIIVCISFLLSMIIVFGVNCFGVLKFIPAETKRIGLLSGETKMSSRVFMFYYETPFGKKIKFSGSRYTVGDVRFRDRKLNEVKIKAAFISWKKDFDIILICTIILSTIFYIFSKYKFKFNE